MPNELRLSLEMREQALDALRLAVRERASERLVALLTSNYDGWVRQDNAIASGTTDLRRGLSSAEMLRRQRARDSEQKLARRRSAA